MKSEIMNLECIALQCS